MADHKWTYSPGEDKFFGVCVVCKLERKSGELEDGKFAYFFPKGGLNKSDVGGIWLKSDPGCDKIGLDLATLVVKGQAPSLPVKRVSIVTGRGMDRIAIFLNLPTSFPVMNYECCVDMQAQQGYGVTWVRDNLGIEPEVTTLLAIESNFSKKH